MPHHYEERLEKDLNRIRERIATMGELVQESLKNSVHALLTGNQKLASATILSDMPINRLMREIDALCHRFIAVHLPSAGHLRFISSVIRTNIELERVGDYAVTICRETVQLPSPPKGELATKVETMAEETRLMLKQAVDAFNEGNAEAAKSTMGMAAQIDRTFDAIFDELVHEESGWILKDIMGLFVVFHRLERVAAQSKNICEETVFAATGQTKAPKTYRILFLDQDNSCLSQMAEAVARKNYPNSGKYSSAGRQAAEEINSGLNNFLQQRGFDLGRALPSSLDLTPVELANFHVIVSLQGPVKSYIAELPFHTISLEWDLGPCPTGLPEKEAQQRLEELYREIAANVQELMETLRGEGAN
jgi:phosphate transport system protein